MHRVAAIGSGTLDSLPHNGAVVTLLAICGSTHRESYLDIVMVGIVSALIALVAAIPLGSMFGSFQDTASASARQMGPQNISSCSVAVFHSIIAVGEFRSCGRKYSDL
jgi:hypothetical protein